MAIADGCGSPSTATQLAHIAEAPITDVVLDEAMKTRLEGLVSPIPFLFPGGYRQDRLRFFECCVVVCGYAGAKTGWIARN